MNEEVVQRVADEMAKKIKQVYGMMPSGVTSGGGGGSSSTRNSIVASPRRSARKTLAETEADVKPPEKQVELCFGGTEPKAGCKDCGDIMYMRTTGQDERYLAHTYEWWRRQHIDYGTDWAKERMLDYIRDEHQGVLDPKWTGDDKPAVPEARQPEKKLWPVGKTLPTIWAALVCVYGTLWVVDGKLLYLLCTVMYAFLVIMNYTVKVRRSKSSSRRKLT